MIAHRFAIRPRIARLIGIVVGCAAVAAGGLAPGATAAPPGNDARAAATPVPAPGSVQGTTAESTLEPGEAPTISGQPVSGTVWYRFKTGTSRRVVLRLTASGDLDAAIEVLRRSRSQLISEQQAITDENGRAMVYVQARGGADYFVRVGQRAGSAPGGFKLELLLPQLPPPPPGAKLPASGASDSVDPLADTADAWSATLHAGTTYRIHLTNLSRRPLRLAVFEPGTTSFLSNAPIKRSADYVLYTPPAGAGGRYSFLVTATGITGQQRYRLNLAQAGVDDEWPGLVLGNYQPRRARFGNDATDVVDTYRFDVVDRSAVDLRVQTSVSNNYSLRLLRASGRRLASTGGSGTMDMTRILRPGRYVVVVRARKGAAGSYVLRRRSRTLTHLKISGPTTLMPPGAAVTLRLALSPSTASGAATVTIERFDPYTGWHYDRTLHTTISGGAGSVSFTPQIGRWRARASYAGTRTAEPSETRRDTRFEVAGPLTP